MDEIVDGLAKLEVRTHNDKYFVPTLELKRYFTRDVVEKSCILAKIQLEDHKQIVQAILARDGHQLFAVLVSCRLVFLITHFIEADHFSKRSLDSILPLTQSVIRDVLRPENLEVSIKEDDVEVIKKVRSDTVKEYTTKILKCQWKYVVPLFESDQSHRSLCNETILPFLKDTPLSQAQGGFSEVYKVKIPAKHHGIAGSIGRNVRYTCLFLNMTPNICCYIHSSSLTYTHDIILRLSLSVSKSDQTKTAKCGMILERRNASFHYSDA